MQGLPAVAAGLFRFLDEECVEYCVLGDVRGFPASVGADLELVMEAAARRLLPSLLKAFCDRNQLQLIGSSRAASANCGLRAQLEQPGTPS